MRRMVVGGRFGRFSSIFGGGFVTLPPKKGVALIFVVRLKQRHSIQLKPIGYLRAASLPAI